MGYETRANDWECVGIANGGGGIVGGGGVYVYEFRSRQANFRGTFLFIGAGVSIGAGFGGTTAPSPAQAFHPRVPEDLWTQVSGYNGRPFSANELDRASGRISSASASAAYGYSGTAISAGLYPNLFQSQDVSGWGTGVSLGLSVLIGMWQLMGDGRSYF